MTANSRFTDGDRVISVRDTSDVPEGFIGTLQHTCGLFDYEVTDDKGKVELFNDDELELLSIGNSVRLEGIVHPTEITGTLHPEHTGGSVNYYKVHVANPTTLPEAYDAEANDIIESLGLTFAEGNLFKAIWRMAADRNGKKKKGNNSVYDAEKLVFFAERVLVQEKARNESK